MSCNCNEDHQHHDCDFNCVSNVVRFIHELQECATTTCGSGCEVPFLGAHNSCISSRYHVLLFYTQKLEHFLKHLHHLQALLISQSPIFRVEGIDDDDCAVLRVLTVVLGDGTSVPPGDDPICTFLAVPNARLVSTSSSITVHLSCFCAIRCYYVMFLQYKTEY